MGLLDIALIISKVLLTTVFSIGLAIFGAVVGVCIGLGADWETKNITRIALISMLVSIAIGCPWLIKWFF